MTRDEFEAGYAARGKMTVEQLRAHGRIVRICRCGAADCPGWQSISRTLAEENDADWPGWDGDEREAIR